MLPPGQVGEATPRADLGGEGAGAGAGVGAEGPRASPQEQAPPTGRKGNLRELGTPRKKPASRSEERVGLKSLGKRQYA